jgi:predicted transcriptional regulator
MFSQSNATFASIDIDFLEHPVFIQQEEAELAENFPAPLKRQTNEWIRFYGAYPTYGALITTEREIAWRLQMGDRHVAGIKIPRSEDRIMRRDVVRKIGDLVGQLDKFSAEGLVWNKSPGCIDIDFDGHFVIFKMYVCDDTEMFHVLVEGQQRLLFPQAASAIPFLGETNEKLNKIIYSVRVMYQENDVLPSFESIELTPEKWEATYDVTREQNMDCVVLPRA